MYRDATQKSMVCQTLLASLGTGKEGLWTLDGPTEEACGDALPLSGGESVLFKLCWVIWQNDDELDFVEIRRLDPSKRKMVGALIIAEVGGVDAIDEWVARYSNS